MRNLLKPIYAFLLLFICFSISAQKPPIKLGNITKQEVAMQDYELDPNADAVVLCDYGYLSFDYNLSVNEWQHHLKRICRIKIFNDDGYNWATEKILLYDNNGNKEEISQIKGYTYNIENGKVVKYKLGKDDIFSEKSSENYKRVKFTLPKVKEGSVIEYSYTINSNNNLILDRWKFQQIIPVKWSEYVVNIPEYFNYLKNSQGFASFYKFETNSKPRSINWSETNRGHVSLSGSTAGSVSQYKIDYRDQVFHWIAKDLPALKDENFVGNINNYHLGVDFQLSTYKPPSGHMQNVLSSWNEINKKFLDDYDNFGPNMRKRSFYKDITEKITAEFQDPMQRSAVVYHYVSQHMKWDGKEQIIPSQNIKKSYDERTGSCSDINALLISMLRAVDIQADPVILSTIDNGLVHPTLPILNKYNYLIAKVSVGDKIFLLDATEKNQPFGMLPFRCLNQRGYTISKTNPGWVSLNPAKGLEKTVLCDLTLLENGTLKGFINNKNDGYSAVGVRNKIMQDGEDKYIENLKSAHTKWSISSVEIDIPEAIAKPVKEKIEFEVNGKAEVMGNMIYIDPMLTGKIEENPLKQEERKLPIEFIVPLKNMYMFNMIVPEGYQVDELPESINLVTPDRTANMRYVVQVMGNRLQLVHSWQIKKSFYLPEKFLELKEFYSLLVSKHNEQIVLKKVQSN